MDWDDLDIELRDLLMFAQRIKLIEINTGSSTIQLHHTVKKDDENHYFRRMKQIKARVYEFEREFLTRTFSQLFFSKYNTQLIMFYECNMLFLDLSKNRKIANVTSQKNEVQAKSRSKKRQADLFFETRTDSTKVSDPRLKSPTERWEQFADLIESKKIEMAIWISKIKRDHNYDPMGRIDEFSDLFKKLVDHYNLTFLNKSGYDRLVGKNDGFCFSMTMNKSGHIHLWVNQTRGYYDWTLFIKQFFNEFQFLSFDEQSQLLQCFEYSRNKLFILETAKTIGPKSLIDANWKGACVACKRLIWKGKFNDVMVWIDYSKGPAEIEFHGAEGPCRLMQELLTMPYEIAESMGRFESILEEFLTQFEFIEQGFMDLSQTIAKNHDALIQNIKESKSQEGTHFDILSSNQRGIITTLDNRFNDVDFQLQQIYDQNSGNQIVLLDSIHNNHEEVIQVVQYTSNKMLSGLEVLDKKIDSKFDDLYREIVEMMDTHNEKFKNNLYLVIRAIHNIPGATINEISQFFNSEDIDIKIKQIYAYVKRLENEGLIKKLTINESAGRKGRKNQRIFLKRIRRR